MALLKVYKNGKLLLDECENANHFFTRFMGLMYRRSMEENHCLLLTPCNEIHTFGMKFDIDTIALKILLSRNWLSLIQLLFLRIMKYYLLTEPYRLKRYAIKLKMLIKF